MRTPKPAAALLLAPALAAAVAAAVAACGSPPVAPSADREPGELGLIEGDLVTLGPARGDAVVLLYRAGDEPPPLGAARPVNFLALRKEELFGDASGAGPFAARYRFPLVEPGSYNVRAFLDADRDFDPFLWIRNQPTAGDVAGGYVDLARGELATVEVRTGEPALAPVLLSSAQPGAAFAWERPAFEVAELGTMSLGRPAPTRVRLRRLGLATPWVEQDLARTRFLVRLADDDGDGVADDPDGDGVPALYPKVVLRVLGEDPLADDPEAVVIPGVVDPTPFLAELGELADGVELAIEDLEVIVPPLAFRPDGLRGALAQGRYSITVVNPTGQLWRIPNELAPDDATLTGAPLGGEGLPSQGVTFRVGP